MVRAASRSELEALLDDDVPHGDLATDALGIAATAGVMRFVARDAMVLALAEDAATSRLQPITVSHAAARSARARQ